MKKKVLVMATLALLVAAPAFADDGSQQSGNWLNGMYQYCSKAMQQWDNQPSQGGQAQPQGQPMAGMMMGSGSMMGR